MDNLIKAALIIAGSIIIAVGVSVYFSPYHSCVRDGYNPVVCMSRR